MSGVKRVVYSVREEYASYLVKNTEPSAKQIELAIEQMELSVKRLKSLCSDFEQYVKREKDLLSWKKKLQEKIMKFPGKEFTDIVSLLCSKKWFVNRKYRVWGVSFGMLFDKLVANGAGKVYELTTGEMIKQNDGLEQDLEAQFKAQMAAVEMEAQVETKKLLAQLLLDIKKAGTPEDVEKLLERFQKEIDPPSASELK